MSWVRGYTLFDVNRYPILHWFRTHLTSTNVDTRCSATRLLSGVLGALTRTQCLLEDDGYLPVIGHES